MLFRSLRHGLSDRLPPESASEDGFKNSSEMLQMSAMQFETYREIALKALKRATVIGERPVPVTYFISMDDEFGKSAKNKRFRQTDKDFDNKRRRQHLFNTKTGEAIHFSGGNAKPRKNGLPEGIRTGSNVVLELPRSNELKMNLDRFLPDDGIMREIGRAHV